MILSEKLYRLYHTLQKLRLEPKHNSKHNFCPEFLMPVFFFKEVRLSGRVLASGPVGPGIDTPPGHG